MYVLTFDKFVWSRLAKLMLCTVRLTCSWTIWQNPPDPVPATIMKTKR